MKTRQLCFYAYCMLLACFVGVECNQLLWKVRSIYFTTYKEVKDSDKILSIERKYLERGQECDYYNLRDFYAATGFLTQEDPLLDYMIGANKYKTPHAPVEAYNILSSLVEVDDIKSLDEKYSSFLLEEIGRGFLLRGAGNGDQECIDRLSDLMSYGMDFYDERLDSLARK